jgi:predicted methyltransferase
VNAVLADVAAAVSLAEGESGVRAVVQVVAQREPVPVREISRATGLPVPLVAATCNELRKRGVVDSARPVRLTTRGRELFGGLARRLSFTGRCDVCEGTGTRIPAELAPVADALALSAEAAPAAQMQLDQSHCTVETKLRRVLALDDADALVGRSVMLLGDDDLVSLAVAQVLRLAGVDDGLADLTVVDVDERLLEFLREQLADAPFPVSLVAHDARAPLPPELAGRFDTVCTDPPYTRAGARVFLSRAVEATGPVPGRHVFFSFGRRPPAEALEVQQAIAELQLVATRIVPRFNEYVGAGILGGVGDLYQLTTTAASRPLEPARYDGPLYTGEVRDPSRTYACRTCGTRVRVGPGEQWPTIGDLKAAGCPSCGASSFDPLARASAR